MGVLRASGLHLPVDLRYAFRWRGRDVEDGLSRVRCNFNSGPPCIPELVGGAEFRHLPFDTADEPGHGPLSPVHHLQPVFMQGMFLCQVRVLGLVCLQDSVIDVHGIEDGPEPRGGGGGLFCGVCHPVRMDQGLQVSLG